jgi:hypothetical protein
VRRHGSKAGDSEPVLPRRKPTRDSRISELTASDHDRAPERLFEFRTTDPACGSAQFLAAMVDERPTSRASFGRHAAAGRGLGARRLLSRRPG